MFYVYEWYIKDTKEIIYVGKGSKKRYLTKQHNKLFKEMIKRFDCESRIIKYFDSEIEAFNYEYKRIEELKRKKQCVCNIYKGGFGGETQSWTDEKRKQYSEYNVMKSEEQRKRMSEQNPMKNPEIAKKVGIKHRKPFYIGNKLYNTLSEASKEYNVKIQTIRGWLNRGHNSKNEIARYKHDNQQPSTSLNDL